MRTASTEDEALPPPVTIDDELIPPTEDEPEEAEDSVDSEDSVDGNEGESEDGSTDEGGADDAGEPVAPAEDTTASLLEQAQEDIASLHFDNASLLRDNEALTSKVTSLEDTIESLRDELAQSAAREQALGEMFDRLSELRAWTASEGRETRLILAADMVEAAKTAIETGGTPDRVLLVPKPIIWPAYVARL